jgi:hypothetical protein
MKALLTRWHLILLITAFLAALAHAHTGGSGVVLEDGEVHLQDLDGSLDFTGMEDCGVNPGDNFIGLQTQTCTQTYGDHSYTVTGPFTVVGFTGNNITDGSCQVTYTLRRNGTDVSGCNCTDVNKIGCSPASCSQAFSVGDTIAMEVVDTSSGCAADLLIFVSLVLDRP